MQNDNWLLPEGIEEVLPPQAAALEELRRELLDLYQRWGYELIYPPFIEYLESLLAMTGGDLDLKTFRVTDLPTGRQLGIRADITPQAARIDAHQLRRDVPTRLCYLGTTLHTKSDGFSSSRAPMQVGAELYGHSGVESDLEIVSLMIESLQRADINEIYLDLGHVGIFRSLAEEAGLNREQELQLFAALQRKATAEIETLLVEMDIPQKLSAMLAALATLNGDDALTRGRELLADAGDAVHSALTELEQLAALLHQRLPGLPLHYDLAELRGYHYHTGVVFAAFIPELGQEIARGGRYDDIGECFGRARPACGFSADLRTLLRLGNRVAGVENNGIFAPWSSDPEQQKTVEELRAEGRRVVNGLPGQQGDAQAMGCREILEKQAGKWVITSAE
jgi:ATP phosphoribosyltransferase regulatory subunit